MKVFVIFYSPGYGDDPYVKGVFSSHEAAVEAMRTDSFYRHSKEGLDFDVNEFELDYLD